jgi:hypothetical protein
MGTGLGAPPAAEVTARILTATSQDWHTTNRDYRVKGSLSQSYSIHGIPKD